MEKLLKFKFFRILLRHYWVAVYTFKLIFFSIFILRSVSNLILLSLLSTHVIDTCGKIAAGVTAINVNLMEDVTTDV